MFTKNLAGHTAWLCSILAMNAVADIINSKTFYGPGDNKEGYETPLYQTASVSLDARVGRHADLMEFINNPPLGLPAVSQPNDNLATTEKLQLGRRLFFDRRLSFNDTFSCAICHIPEQGFTNNELSTAVGVEGRSGKRNSPTLYNIAYPTRLFHDGRETTLEQQAWAPILAHNEMANPSIGYVIEKIKNIKDYDGLFEQAFDGKGPTTETIGMALATYQRTLVSGNSRFDRWYYGKEKHLISKQEEKGFALFVGKASCSACHTIKSDSALFTDNLLHNTGMGYRESMGEEHATKQILVAPGVYMVIDQAMINTVKQKPKQNDLGLYEITQNPYDRWKYRTPTLRNVVLTAPYMHNGRFTTLREVIEFYNQGGVPNELLSPLIKPLNLTEDEINALVSFLHTLTGDNIETLVADGFAAPIGDTRNADPDWAHEYLSIAE